MALSFKGEDMKKEVLLLFVTTDSYGQISTALSQSDFVYSALC
jgi:hypothetical protein